MALKDKFTAEEWDLMIWATEHSIKELESKPKSKQNDEKIAEERNLLHKLKLIKEGK